MYFILSIKMCHLSPFQTLLVKFYSITANLLEWGRKGFSMLCESSWTRVGLWCKCHWLGQRESSQAARAAGGSRLKAAHQLLFLAALSLCHPWHHSLKILDSHTALLQQMPWFTCLCICISVRVSGSPVLQLQKILKEKKGNFFYLLKDLTEKL